MSSALPSGSNVIPSTNQSAIHAFTSRTLAAPKPQPGKYPVVFSTGAGKPTNTAPFQPLVSTIKENVRTFPSLYKDAPRYRELLMLLGITHFEFSKRLQAVTLLAIAQQLVHAHQQLGLPLGDFSPVSSTEFVLPSAVAAYVQQFGELSVDTVGTRFTLASYKTTISSLVLRAKKIMDNALTQEDIDDELTMLDLPMESKDPRVKFVVAVALNRWLKEKFHLWMPCSALQSALFSGDDLPPLFKELRPLLGDADHVEPAKDRDGEPVHPEDVARLPEATRPPLPYSHMNRLEFLFEEYADSNAWSAALRKAENHRTLLEIGINFGEPMGSRFNFDFHAKKHFSDILQPWIDQKDSILKFLTCANLHAARSAACGSLSQLSAIEKTSGTTTVSSYIACLAPEYSLLTCFHPEAVLCPRYTYDVKVTTQVRTQDRAQEFVSRDWAN